MYKVLVRESTITFPHDPPNKVWLVGPLNVQAGSNVVPYETDVAPGPAD
jgi:hypothetical protein